ncbi:MAG: ATP-binding cassette domain-containing protein, partial [Albidovulum sp.]|nr:ATP-binding cassette domain-containing protein [Albidovulum sp.]
MSDFQSSIDASARAMAAGVPVFEARGISKSYGHVEAFVDVDYEVRRGEVAGLLNDNGSGKSTLMKILSGAVQSDSGEFYREGRRADISTRTKSKEDGGSQTNDQDIALVKSM